MLFRLLYQWFKRRRAGRDAAGGAGSGSGSGAASGSGTAAGLGAASGSGTAAGSGAASGSAAAGRPGDQPISLERGARAMSLELQNVRAVARREYLARARTRSFRITTVVLVVVAIGVALAPIGIRLIDQGSGPSRIEVSLGSSASKLDIVAQLQAILNSQATSNPLGGGAPTYAVSATTDETGARAAVASGALTGLLIVGRGPATSTGAEGDLAFTFVTKAKGVDRISQLMQVAATGMAQADRLARSGLTPAQQAGLVAPVGYATQLPDGTTDTSSSPEDYVNSFAVGFVLAIILFMAIILYGQWVAYSVAEEKSSRVMEVILGAASPLELLAGKVVGVGGLALTQYAIIFVPALLIVLLQDQIASLVLGEPAAAASLPAGLSIELLVVWGILFLLGFALYATLYAGAAALVSRTEDINAIVAPMTMVSVAGYLVAVYSSTGLISPDAPFVHVMALIPFFSPYLVLSLLGQHAISGIEVVAAIVLLAVFVPIALWVAARLYAAGVLMYGQRPGLKLLSRVLRGG
ncbi:MAG TPA: ABC transporter permease [Candidatus Limnocylindrales bacterium]